MTTYIIGRFAGSNVGGAELSTEELGKVISKDEINYIRLSDDHRFHDFNVNYMHQGKTIRYPLIKNISRLSIYIRPVLIHHLCLVRMEEFDFINDNDLVLGVGIDSIPILLRLKNKCLFVARSITDLSFTPQYGFGMLRIKRIIKYLIDYIPATFYRFLLKKYIKQNNHLAVNSKFMKNVVIDNFTINNNKIKVYLPEPKIKESIKISINKKTKGRFNKLILVGDSEGKGFHFFRRIVKEMKYDKNFKNICIARSKQRYYYSYKENIHFYPWGSFFHLIDRKSILLIPSQWKESFCRVAKEGCILNIPVIAFKRGGIVEALKDHKESILLPYSDDTKPWLEAINKVKYI